MLKIKFLDDIFSKDRRYRILPQEDDTSILEDVTAYTQKGTKINALLMQKIVDEINTNTPVGVIHPFAGSIAPDGYLLCDGREINRKTYEDLFRIIGTMYGIGDGETTFQLPNLCGSTMIGSDQQHILGNIYGKNEAALTQDELPSHTHTLSQHSHTANGTALSAGAHNHTASSGSSGAHAHTASSGSAGSHSHTINIVSSGSHAHYGIFYGGASKNFSLNSGSSMYRLSWSGDGANDGGSYYTGGAGAHVHNASASTAAAHAHTVAVASGGAHSHTVSVANGGAHTHALDVQIGQASSAVSSTGNSKPHSNLQQSMAVNYIIKF